MRKNQSAYRLVEAAENSGPIAKSLMDALTEIRRIMANSDDMVMHRIKTPGGVEVGVVFFEGMVTNLQISDFLMRPLGLIPARYDTPERVWEHLRGEMLLSGDVKEARSYDELLTAAMAGFAAVIVEGRDRALMMAYQGFATRGVSEPSAENNLRGSREGFSESIIQNISLIRRRLKSTRLTVEPMTVGTLSNTMVKLLYLRGVATQELVAEVKRRLAQVKINILLDSGYLQPFIAGSRFSLFSGTWVTERPDTFCAKLGEGRIGVLVDGTPFALIVPYLFAEHFQSLDDYSHRPYFASFIRIIKFLSFFVTVLLPGCYVAVFSFHPELIPEALLADFIAAASRTPLPLLAEAVVVFVLYELLREAGLRLPRPIGHAMGIVGGIVIGDTAVKAGIIGLPMVIVIAITAVSSFVVPSLYEPVTVLRLAFILLGGLTGLYGVFLGVCLLTVNLCSMEVLGIPVTSPITPADLHSFRDLFVRASWKKLQKDTLIVEDIKGASEKMQT